MEAATPREMDGRRPFLTCLFSSHIFVSLFEEVHLILHLSLPPRTFHQLLCLMHSSKHKQFMKTEMHLYSRRTEITTKKSYPKTHLLNPLPSILTTIQLLGASASHSSNLRTYSNLSQIQSDTCAFMVLCMEWNLLAVGHCGKRFSKVVMVKMMLSRRKLVGLMDGWRKNVEKDRVAQICLGSRNSKKSDHTARLK